MKSCIILYFVIFLFNISLINCSLKFPLLQKDETCFIEDIISRVPFLIRYTIAGFDYGTTDEEKRKWQRK